MANVFKQMGKNASPFILIAWPLAILLLVIAFILMVEDYNTSRLGYLFIPTRKVNVTWVPYAVALVPQAGQVVIFFIYGRDTNRRWALVTVIALFLVDYGTDVYFKSLGLTGVFSWMLLPLAMAESLFVFTLGSEVMFALMSGFILETMHEFMTVFGQFLNVVISGLESLAASLKGDGPPSRR